MKTQYFRRHKQYLSPVQGVAAAVAVVLIAVLAVLRIFFPGALAAVAAPLWSAGDYLAVHAGFPKGSAALQAEVDRLRAENAALASENRILAATAGDEAAKSAGIMAGVLARPPQSPYDALIIAKGNDDGVYAGMRVLAAGVPVGVVESASSGSARVVLYSASGQESEGWIGTAKTPVTLHGLGAGAFAADVPREAGAAEGDIVYLPGPGALPMGTVMKVESSASSPRAILRIRPYANPFTMTSVHVVATPSP